MTQICFMTEHAREALGAGDDWTMASWEVIGHPAVKLMEIKGAVFPPKKSGPNKGEPNFRAVPVSKYNVVHFTPEEHEAWVSKWEEKTGLCARCQGTGEEWAGWCAVDGTRYKKCTKCDGRGKQ